MSEQPQQLTLASVPWWNGIYIWALKTEKYLPTDVRVSMALCHELEEQQMK